jgi:transposase InsO family protein
VVVCTEYISYSFMSTVMELLTEQFPFTLQGVHADNGVEYINARMLELMESARIALTKSRPARSTDNALVESKNGSVVRKRFGFVHIARSRAGLINDFNREHFNPLNNLHRSCLFASEQPHASKPGRIKRVYHPDDAQTPLEKLASLPRQLRNLKKGVTIKALLAQAQKQTDLQAAQACQAAWDELEPRLYHRRA